MLAIKSTFFFENRLLNDITSFKWIRIKIINPSVPKSFLLSFGKPGKAESYLFIYYLLYRTLADPGSQLRKWMDCPKTKFNLGWIGIWYWFGCYISWCIWVLRIHSIFIIFLYHYHLCALQFTSGCVPMKLAVLD